MITIFTPTYNRRKLLERCYSSLVEQTDKSFEWLIIDDGSTDDTKQYVKKIQQNSPFKINYIFQKNGGKHRAHNTAVVNCKTEYFLILDSDDCIDRDCIKILNEKIKIIDKNDNISGIIGNRYEINSKKIIGTKIPNNQIISGIELYQKLKFKGDTLRLYKTKILKQYLFPEIENEKFIYENVVFDSIDTKYKMLTLDSKLYYGEYQDDGYTSNSNRLKINNPIGYMLSLKSSIETSVIFNKKVSWTILYIIWCKKMKIDGFKNFKYKVLYISLVPLALFFYMIKFPRFFFNIFDMEEK